MRLHGSQDPPSLARPSSGSPEHRAGKGWCRIPDQRPATEVAQEALTTGKSVYDLVLAKGLLSKETLDNILPPEMLTKPRALATKRE